MLLSCYLCCNKIRPFRIDSPVVGTKDVRRQHFHLPDSVNWVAVVTREMFFFVFLPKSGIPGHFSAKISYILEQVENTPQEPCYWPGWHRDWFWLEKAKVYLTLSTLSINSFQLVLANFEPIREAIRTLFFFSVCACPPSIEILLY